MGTSYSTTTQSSSLPSWLTSGLQTAVNQTVNNGSTANPIQGLTQGTAQWGNPAQMGATQTTSGLAGYQAQPVYDGWTTNYVGANYAAPQVNTGYVPMQVGNDYAAGTLYSGDVTRNGSPTVSGSDIQQMQNPYTQQVVQTSLDELNRQLAQTNQAAAGQAASAGAFGGDRAAIVQAENARNANQIGAQTIANLNNQGFQTAAQLAQQNAARQLQAGTSQTQIEAQIGQANQSAGLQAQSLRAAQDRANQAAWSQAQALSGEQDRSNQYADLQAENLNATQDRANQNALYQTQALDSTQQRANQSAGLNAANLDLSAANQLNTIGNTYQNTQQNALTNEYNQQYRDGMWPITNTTTMDSNLGTLAGLAGKTSTTSTTSPDGNYLTSGLGAATSLNSLTGGALTSGVKSLFGGSGSSSSGTAGTVAGDQASSVFNTNSFGTGVSDSGSSDLGSIFDTSGVTAARGGLIGYASGGAIGGDGGADSTYVPVDPTPQVQAALSPNPAAIVESGLRAPRFAGKRSARPMRFDGGGSVPMGDGATNISPELIAEIWRQRLLQQAAQQGGGGLSVSASEQPPVDPASVPAPDAASVPQPSAATVPAPPDEVGSSSVDPAYLANRAGTSASSPQDVQRLLAGYRQDQAQPQAGLAAAAQQGSGPAPAAPTPDQASPVDAALAPNPANIVTQGPQAGLGPTPKPQDRLTRSADPSAPMPNGYSGGSDAPQPGLAGASLSGNGGAPVAPQAGLGSPSGAAQAPAATPPLSLPQMPDGRKPGDMDWNKFMLGMGAAMMASHSPHFLQGVGEGIQGGLKFAEGAEDLRAKSMKNDMTSALLPQQLAALSGATGAPAAGDPGQAEVLRLRAARDRAQVLGDGRTYGTINNQLLEIARDGRVTGADGKVYTVPNAEQLAFGHTYNQSTAGEGGKYPFQVGLQNHQAGNNVMETNLRQQGEAAGAEPIQATVADGNGNPVSVLIPRLAWRQQNLGEGQSNGLSPAGYAAMIKGYENRNGSPDQANASGPGGTPTSTAVGDGQFIQGTWLSQFKQAYPDVAQQLSDSQILKLRGNPQVSADMTARYAVSNGQVLQSAGLPVTSGSLALAHNLGPQGAAAVMSAPPATPLAQVLGPSVMSANPNLRNLTAGQLTTRFASRFGTAPVPFVQSAAYTAPATPAAQGATPSAPAAPPPAPGLPPGTMATGKPVLTPESEALAKGRGEQASQIVEAGNKAPSIMARLDAIQNSLPDFRPGASGNLRASAAKSITDLYQLAGMTPPDWAMKGATASDTIQKEGGYLAAEMTRTLGSREAMGVFNQIRSITPNLELSNGGFQVVLNSVRQGAQRDQDLANYQDAWLSDPSHHGSTAGMMQAFNRERPVEAYASRVVPYPTPKSQNAAIPGVIYRLPSGGTAQWTVLPDGTKGFKPVQPAGQQVAATTGY